MTKLTHIAFAFTPRNTNKLLDQFLKMLDHFWKTVKRISWLLFSCWIDSRRYSDENKPFSRLAKKERCEWATNTISYNQRDVRKAFVYMSRSLISFWVNIHFVRIYGLYVRLHIQCFILRFPRKPISSISFERLTYWRIWERIWWIHGNKNQKASPECDGLIYYKSSESEWDDVAAKPCRENEKIWRTTQKGKNRKINFTFNFLAILLSTRDENLINPTKGTKEKSPTARYLWIEWNIVSITWP